MARQETERIISNLPSVKYHRRRVIKLGSLAAASFATFVGYTADMMQAIAEGDQLTQHIKKTYPPSEETTAALDQQVTGLVAEKKIEEARELIRSDAYVEKVLFQAQSKVDAAESASLLKKDSTTLVAKDPYAYLVGAANTIVAAFFGFIKFEEAKTALNRASKGAKDRLLFFFPNWKTTPPSAEEITVFEQKISALPPVGGKIPDNDGHKLIRIDDGAFGILPPTFTAEESWARVLKLRRNGELGAWYVSQLSVQGRLPDAFKFAAIALILDSPPYNWERPHFAADWGKIAPLIHDGGNVQRDVNPLWRGVKGRTDFIQNIAIVPEPNIEQLEQMNPEERAGLPFEQQVNARYEQLEEERLQEHARFYQRSAFCLHAKIGTAPKQIPKETKIAAARVWDEFEEQMKSLLNKYGTEDVGNVEWFRKKAVYKPGWSQYGERQEADWSPIQQALLHMQQLQQEHPEIRPQARQLILEFNDVMDHILGISYTQPYMSKKTALATF